MPAGDILNLVVTDSPSTTVVVVAVARRMATSSASVSVTYEIRVNNASVTTTSLTQALEQSVSSGQFTLLLTASSLLYNATALENATSSAVAVENLITSFPTNAPTASGNGEDSPASASMPIGLIVGIVVGCLLLGAGLGYYYKTYHISAESSGTGTLTPNTKNGYVIRENPVFQNAL